MSLMSAGPLHPPHMFYMPPPAGPHSHLSCGGCQTLLMYPQGASNVRCSRCGHITTAPPSTGPETAQIVCNHCRVLLSYPRGAQSVQCSLCQTITQVPMYGHVICGGCNVMLMYPLGAHSVKCSVCHSVTAPSAFQNGQVCGQTSATTPSTAVMVENPPSLDDQGNEVANLAVGVKAEGH